MENRIYKKMKKTACFLMMTTPTLSLVTQISPILSGFCGLSVVTSSVLYVVLNELINKKIKQVRPLYEEFIKNYNKLNKIFDLKNPAELQAMFVWSLERGYLSLGKEFEMDEIDKKQLRDYIAIFGANIFIGTGLCRHIGPLYTDILNAYGIETFNLPGIEEKYDSAINILYEQQKLMLQMMKEVLETLEIEEKDFQEIEDDLKQKREELEKARLEDILSCKVEKRKDREGHLISLSLYNGEIYYLGPYRHEVYEHAPVSNLLYSNKTKFKIRENRFCLYNDKKSEQRLKDLVKSPYPCASKEEILTLMERTETMCEQNRDIFEQFYKDNRGLYEEVSMKLRKI